jgi:hypothetical protein
VKVFTPTKLRVCRVTTDRAVTPRVAYSPDDPTEELGPAARD